VFIGRTVQASTDPMGASADTFLTPYHPDLMSGVEIQANIFETLRKQRTKHLVSARIYVFSFLAWIFLLGFFLWNQSPQMGAFILFSGVLLLEGISLGLFKQNIVFPIVPFVLYTGIIYGTSVGMQYLKKKKERDLIRTQFTRYLPEQVVRHVLKEPDKLVLGGDRRIITLLFADIAGFTTLSEKISPEVLIGLLQEHLSDMTEAIFNASGTLDKYLGDGIMAFWGAPEPMAHHDHKALQAAKEMLLRLDDANRERAARHLPELNLHIGLHTGESIVGNIGSVKFLDYTAIGDTVNTASRVEGVNKALGTRLLVSETCLTFMGDEISAPLFPVGRFGLKGREAPLFLYTIPSPGEEGAYESLKKFLDLVDENNLDAARDLLNQLLQKFPEFGPFLFYQHSLSQNGSLNLDQSNKPYCLLTEK
jgi:adenylate cyclase